MKLTDILGVYAAVLSTVVLLWNIQKSIPKIKVIVVGGLKESATGSQFGIQIEIKNHSSHTVYVTSATILYPDQKVSLFRRLAYMFKYRRFPKYVGWIYGLHFLDNIETGLPVAIEPWNSHPIFIPDKALYEIVSSKRIRRIVVNVQDALWRNQYSNVYEMHPIVKDEWH